MITQCLLLFLPCLILYATFLGLSGKLVMRCLTALPGIEDISNPSARFCVFITPVVITFSLIYLLFMTLIPYMATEGWLTSVLFTMFFTVCISGIGMFIGALWDDSFISCALDAIGVNKTLKQVFGLAVATQLTITLAVTIGLMVP